MVRAAANGVTEASYNFEIAPHDADRSRTGEALWS